MPNTSSVVAVVALMLTGLFHISSKIVREGHVKAPVIFTTPQEWVPQGPVLALLLFNICISDLQTTVSRKYEYADVLAIMHADGDWQAVEAVVTKDMATVGEYLQTWKLKINTIKTVSAAFHLNNRNLNMSLKSNTTMKPCPSSQSLNTSE